MYIWRGPKWFAVGLVKDTDIHLLFIITFLGWIYAPPCAKRGSGNAARGDCEKDSETIPQSPMVTAPFTQGSLRAKIEQTAQAILDARALYPDCSLADLYDELTMPPELRKAHQENDKAVMQAYGFDIKTTTESSCVAELMKMYQELTKEAMR